MHKVVYNSDFGGYSISKAAAEYLLANKIEEPYKSELEEDLKGDRFYGYTDIPRHHKLLVECVEKLGEKANGNMSRLRVHTLEGNQYLISEYNGSESVKEPTDRINWITI